MPRSDVATTLHSKWPTATKPFFYSSNLPLLLTMSFLHALSKLRTLLSLRLFASGAMFFVCFTFSPTSTLASKYAAIVIEEASGKVLFSRNADHLRYPASLTKIMTLYLLFEDIEAGRITLKSRMPVSKQAAGRTPSKLYLKPGQSISAEQAVFALVTKSANDVATAIAEKLSGTERKFAQRMTRKARALGMRRTTFKNASGLPNRQQKSTARDMAKLAVAMRRDFPQFYKYFSTRSFNWNGRKYGNHNKLLTKYKGTDGIKTGYIDASGFNLVATVERKGLRLIGVVFGGKTSRSRDRHMMKILDNQFKKANTLGVRRVALSLPTTLPTTAPKRRQKNFKPLPVNETAPRQKFGTKQDEFIDHHVASLTDSNIAHTTSWSIQIGNFAQRVNAHRAAIVARRMADDVLLMIPANLSLVTHGEMPLWRVRFNDLNENQARTACAALFSAGQRCIAVAVTNTSRG